MLVSSVLKIFYRKRLKRLTCEPVLPIGNLNDKNSSVFRSTHRRCSVKIAVLRNLEKFAGKRLCQSLLFNKVAGLRPVPESLF